MKREIAERFREQDRLREQPPPPPRMHQCGVCGKNDFWGESWAWYGSYALYELGYWFTTCSEACRAVAPDSEAFKQWDLAAPEVMKNSRRGPYR